MSFNVRGQTRQTHRFTSSKTQSCPSRLLGFGGKREHHKIPTSPPAPAMTTDPTAAAGEEVEAQKMEESSSTNWRKSVDDNLNRLHSLLFAADAALLNSDFSSAYLLSLRLLGFLDSRSLSDLDSDYIRPIRAQVLSKLHQSRRGLAPDSDRYCRLFVCSIPCFGWIL